MSFSCMECGHVFKSVKAAERAAFSSKGCPKCGGSDIDLSPTKKMFAPYPGHPSAYKSIPSTECDETWT
jgi:predicted  nucleic acid-binding Zn-ribbon protein